MYNNNLTYDSSYGTASSADPSAMIGILVAGLLIGVIAYVVTSFFLGKLFKKAGVEAWKAWVPVYNQWVFLELGGQKGWISLLYLAGVVPLVGFIGVIVAAVFSCIAAYRIGLNFGKEGVFVLLYIFLGIVWIIWLAVDKTAVWKPAVAAPSSDNGPTTPPQNPSAGTPSQPAAM